MLRRGFITAALAAALDATCRAAQVAPTVRGSRDDLRGARRVYVDTSFDRALGDAVVSEIKAQLPELTISDAPEGADLVVRVARGVADETRDRDETRDEPPYSADQTMSRTPPPLSRRLPRPGERPNGDEPDEPDGLDAPSRYLIGSVLRPVPGGPMREALSFKQPVRTKAESTARDFVRKFAKEYRKANGTD